MQQDGLPKCAKVRKNVLLSRPSLGTDLEVGKRRPQYAFNRAATLADYPPRCYRSGVDWACHFTDGDGDESTPPSWLTFPWAEKRPGATVVKAALPDEKWLYRVGGISALTLGIAYIIIIPLFVHVGAPPKGGEVWLKYLQGKTTVWWTILWLGVLTDFLYIPVALALYFALERVNRSAMLLASVFVGLFVALDLTVTWANYAALLTLSGPYAAVTNEVQRAGLCSPAANYASSVPHPYRGLLRHRRPFHRNFYHRFRDVEGERNFQEDHGLFGPGRRRVWIDFRGKFLCSRHAAYRSHHDLVLVCGL